MRLQLLTVATSHGTGPFHPAIRNGSEVLYWPNITMASEDEAQQWAQTTLTEEMAQAQATALEWNVVKAP